MANQYFLRSRLSEHNARQVIRCFAGEFTETATAKETLLPRKTVNTHFLKIRRAIYIHDRRRFSIPLKKLQIDKQYLLSNQQLIQYDNDSKNTFPILAIMLMDGKLITDVFCTASEALIWKIILKLDNSRQNKEIFNFNMANSKFKPRDKGFNIHQNQIFHKNGKNIAGFWRISGKRLNFFYGLAPDKFILHLKESQWRFNNLTYEQMRYNDKLNGLYRKLLKILRNNPI